jgi:hypothetical protein
MALGLRYPREHLLEQYRDVQGSMNTSTSLSTAGAGMATYQSNCCILKAPARYSQVRKVIFTMTTGVYAIASAEVTLSIMRGQTGIGGLQTRSLPAGGKITSAATDYAAVPTLKTAYTKVGPQTSIVVTSVTAQQMDRIGIIQIEFDRFEADAADFFADWDSVTDPDEYIYFTPQIKQVSSSSAAAHAFRFKNFTCVVVQAPHTVNSSCLEVTAFGGVEDAATGRTTYDANFFPARRSFVYNAADWDGISSIHAVAFGNSAKSGGNNTLTIKLSRLLTSETEQILSEQVFTALDIHYLVRTTDLKSFLVDGGFYFIDYKLGTVNSGRPNFSAYFEIIQHGFTKTVCKHQIDDISVRPTTTNRTNAGATIFDPTWYQGYTNGERITRRVFYSSISNANNGGNLQQTFRSTGVVQSDDTLRGDAFAVDLVNHTTTGGPRGIIVDDFPLANNQDPIEFVGQRRFQKSYPTSNWTAGSSGGWSNFPGGMLLYYALGVPNTEFPELGEVFPLGAFNPEGCASTSAGLGDPGVLVITNGTTIPKKFNPLAGLIEDNGVPTPFEEETPGSVVDNNVSSPDGGLGIGVYRYRYTLRNCCTGKESDPNPDDIIVDTTGASPAAKVTLSFGSIRIPGDEQICEICIYRTVLGGDFPVMAKVGCLDVDDVTGLFVDDVSDDALDFINEGLSLLNAPMPCVPIVAEFRNRLFAMGDIPQLSPAGTVSVTSRSKYVTGDANVEWDRCLEGKYIQLEGDCRPYEIDRVLPPELGTSPPIARLKLVDEYEGDNQTGMLYTICGRPNRVYISEPLEPECWPVSNFIDVEPGDGDRIMGAASNFDRLVICKRNKTYVLAFSIQPATEVNVPSRISSDIGCIAPRSFAQVESGTVWLADRGLVLYDGRSVQHVPESGAMNDIFVDEENPRYIRRDSNGRVIDAIGVFYPKREQYLLLLPTIRSDRGADIMLVWDTKLRNVTLLEFCQQFQSMVVAKDSDGNERVYLGDTNGFVWIYDVGDNDGAGFPNQTGTLRGRVTDAGVEATSGAPFLDDSTASFVEGGLPALAGLSGIDGLSGAVLEGDLGLAGACVFTRSAGAKLDDPWTSRFIFAATNTRLYITPSWGDDLPAVGDDYMIGAINMAAIFKPNNYGTDDQLKRDWQQVLVHEPESVASIVRVELIPDFALSDDEELTVVNKDDTVGAGRVFDMSFPKGRQVRPVGRRVYNFMQVKMSNFAPDEPVRILNHILRSAPRS